MAALWNGLEMHFGVVFTCGVVFTGKREVLFKRFLNYEYEKKSLKKENTLFLFKNLISCIVLSLSELPPCV